MVLARSTTTTKGRRLWRLERTKGYATTHAPNHITHGVRHSAMQTSREHFSITRPRCDEQSSSALRWPLFLQQSKYFLRHPGASAMPRERTRCIGGLRTNISTPAKTPYQGALTTQQNKPSFGLLALEAEEATRAQGPTRQYEPRPPTLPAQTMQHPSTIRVRATNSQFACKGCGARVLTPASCSCNYSVAVR